MRKQIEEQLQMVSEKEKQFREFRQQLEGVLEQTQRCPECPSRGEKQDCGPCRNLKALETAVLGLRQ